MRETWWFGDRARERLTSMGLGTLAQAIAASGDSPLLSSDRQSELHRLTEHPELLVKWRHVRPGRRLRTLLRKSHERREALAYLRARALGIPSPAPLAVGELRHCGFLVGSVLVRPFLDEHEAACADVDDAALARALRVWHDAGFRHGACYPKNLLVPRRGGPIVPIGCSNARFTAPGFRPSAGRRKDLAQLASGLLDLRPGADPLAFLRTYAPDRDLAEWVRPRFDALTASRRARRLSQPAPSRPVPLSIDLGQVPRSARPFPFFGNAR